MRNPLLVPDLRELMRDGETDALRDFFGDLHPATVAEVLEDMEPEEADTVFALLEPRARAEVMSYLDGETQVRIVEAMPTPDAAELFHLMSHDERADLVNRLDDDRVDEILRHMRQAEREDIRRLASYEQGTAGAVMTTDYAELPPGITAREALDRLRHEAPDKETIYTSYVTDSNRRLVGFVTLKKLILARPSARIEEVMQRDLIVARVDEDQENVARQIGKYDLIAIPVVDAADTLLGIVTHDDAMDILREEQTEDILAFGGVVAGVEGEDTPYWQSRITVAVQRRIGWLLLLFFGGAITSFVMNRFSGITGRVNDPRVNLEVFIPLLIGTGGNAGSQTVSTIIRGLALGEIYRSDVIRVLIREWMTGLLLGALLGILGFFYMWLIVGKSHAFSAVIGLSILGICMWANTVGAMVPLLARRLGIDPALVSAPLISTLVDATGLIIYYTVAIFLLT